MLPFLPAVRADAPLRVLCLGAHSDDIEIGCGATLLRLAEEMPGLAVDWVVFSAGPVREREARLGADLFLGGVRERRVIVKNFRNGYFPYVGSEIKDFFEELKAGPRPDIVFTHLRSDRHQDHRTISDLTWNTFRDHLILEYEIPKYDGDLGSPNLFVPITSDVCRRKVEHLHRAFGSQRDKQWFDADTFRGLMRLRGVEACADSGLAEAFYMRKAVFSPVRSAGVADRELALATAAP